MRKLYLLFSLLILTAVPSWAQGYASKVDVFAGYSFASNELLLPNEQSNLNGATIGVTYNFTPNWGATYDFSWHTGDEQLDLGLGPVNVDNYLYWGGPRYTFGDSDSRVRPFVHGLLGVQNTRALGFSVTDFAWGAGGGVDIRVNDNFSIRPVQAEYFGVDSDALGTTTNFRYSGGVVVKF